MELSLHSLKLNPGVIKKRKRVGRGNASGHGTYSCRGLKGQKSRTGGRNNLKRLGFKQTLASLPKSRGFKSQYPKNQVVSLFDINKNFKDESEIDATSLFNCGLIKNVRMPIKILANGELKLKNLKFRDIKTSETVFEQIKKMGGKIS